MLSAAANTNDGSADLRIIILAAGDGTRMADFTRRLHGREVPKQSAELLVGRSLLQETVMRASRLASPDRMYVVVPRVWAGVSKRQLSSWPGINLVVQPENRGTAVGVLLPLAVVLADAPDASMVVMPSHDYIVRSEPFLQAIHRALAATSTSCVALLGVVPDRAGANYGWILPGDPLGEDVYRVGGFVDNPTSEAAMHLQAAGGLWNSLVMAARAARLWQSVSAMVPGIARTIASLWRQESQLGDAYRTLPSVHLSHTVLASHAEMVVLPVKGSGWAGLDSPDGVFGSLGGTGHLQPLLWRVARQSRSSGSVRLSGN
ncbi:MAG: NTP transferase domain-containing protein [Deltaproteobacteria bacterium]|nr:NTP transferase domain-containing protein [Deltaproteobacteria bacterium]